LRGSEPGELFRCEHAKGVMAVKKHMGIVCSALLHEGNHRFGTGFAFLQRQEPIDGLTVVVVDGVGQPDTQLGKPAASMRVTTSSKWL